MSDSLDIITGRAFTIERDRWIIQTKYFSGVAMMQLPFFVVAEIVQQFIYGSSTGFDVIHHKMILVARAFYGAVGLMILYIFCHDFFAKRLFF